MTVKELLEKMEGCSSYGVYTKHATDDEAHADSKTIIKYLDRKVERFNVWIYDEKESKKIRCCIYLED